MKNQFRFQLLMIAAIVFASFGTAVAASFITAAGTTATVWSLGGPAGPALVQNGSAVEVRSPSGGGLTITRGLTPVGTTDYVTKSYSDNQTPAITCPAGSDVQCTDASTNNFVNNVQAITGNDAGVVPVGANCTVLAVDGSVPVPSCVYSLTTTGATANQVYITPNVGCGRWSVDLNCHDSVNASDVTKDNTWMTNLSPFEICSNGTSVIQGAGGAVGAPQITNSSTFLADASAIQFIDASSVGIQVACPVDGGVTPNPNCVCSVIVQQQVAK